jgi:hypothetical protein
MMFYEFGALFRVRLEWPTTFNLQITNEHQI